MISIGNPLSYDGWTYTWKWGRRLATAGNTSQGISTSYKYNDSGIRTYKQVTDNGSTTTYKYNLMGSNITYEERTGANACELYYAYDNGGKLYGFYYDGSSNDGFYYYKRNLQGDIIGILNSSGTEVTTYIYDAWGKLVSKTGSLASTVGSDNPFRYRGYYYDDETSLYYLNQRYYNPNWRRFINADTFMGRTGGLLTHNVFAYCGNNPVMIYDPNGDTWLFALAGAVIGGVIGAASQVISNVIEGNDWHEGVIGAAVGGAVTGAIIGATGGTGTAAAAYAGAAAESFTNEVLSYTPLAGDDQKELTGQNIQQSVTNVFIDTAVNGTANYIALSAGGKIYKTNSGWFKPSKLKTCFIGNYAKKLFWKQGVVSGLMLASPYAASFKRYGSEFLEKALSVSW